MRIGSVLADSITIAPTDGRTRAA